MTNKGDDLGRPITSPARRPVGDVVGVSVSQDPAAERPVTVEVEGRRCLYELSWSIVDGQPAVTDLRVVPPEGETVTARDLRINLNRIAAAVALVDTADEREAWADAQRALEDAAEQAGLRREGYEWVGSVRPTEAFIAALALRRHSPANDKRGRGRPKLPDTHYVAVAELVLALKAAESRSLYRDFAARWPDHPPSSTVRDWIAECKRRDLLADDELRSRAERRTTRDKETKR